MRGPFFFLRSGFLIKFLPDKDGKIPDPIIMQKSYIAGKMSAAVIKNTAGIGIIEVRSFRHALRV